LMTDIDEYLIIKNGICGGMTMVCHRYVKANNPQCPDYEPSKPKSWALYEDMNALYSGAMTQYIPTEILDKVSPEEIPNIQSIAPDAEIVYILEVDLEALVHLHDYFADYPLAPEKQIVSENWLSLYNEIALKFRQSPWMKKYIEENIRKRKIAKANREEFGVMYYKLKNNAIFGKQMENASSNLRE
ncbi:32968_t:CDS:2, partial [Racocetra persica]